MSVLFVLVTALLTLQSEHVFAEYDTPGTCEINGPWVNAQGGSEDNINRITGMGEMAVIVKDPAPGEAAFSCIKLTLNSNDNTFLLKYVDGSGAAQTKSGEMTVKRVVPVTGSGIDVYYEMKDLQGTSILGNGKAYPVYVGGNMVIIKTCGTKFSFPVVFVASTYFLVPLKKAIEEKACNCPDWSA